MDVNNVECVEELVSFITSLQIEIETVATTDYPLAHWFIILRIAKGIARNAVQLHTLSKEQLAYHQHLQQSCIPVQAISS